MKDKILKAIDKGLMNVLSTDITDQDIVFDHNNINNEYIPEVTLEELNDIFNKDKDSIFQKKLNTMDAISLILDNDAEIPLYMYEKGMNVEFVKISNNVLHNGNNEILISKTANNSKAQHQTMYWQKTNLQVQPDEYLVRDSKHAITDYSGYDTCRRIMKCKKTKVLAAVEYCWHMNINGHHGYLPSIGQMALMLEYIDLINYVLKYAGISGICIDDDYWWSCTEKSYDDVWCLGEGDMTPLLKTFAVKKCLPIFTYKKGN